MKQHRPQILIIGVGNAYRRDDAVGLVVAHRLQERNLHPVRVIEESGEGTALMEVWKDADNVILIDAVHSGARPGKIYRLEAHNQPIPTKFFHYSTHAFSVAEAVELARALKKLPSRLIVYGVEGKDFEAGEGLSPEVERAVSTVTDAILEEFRSSIFLL